MTNWTKIQKATGTNWNKVAKPQLLASSLSGSPMGFLLLWTYSTTTNLTWTKITKAVGTNWTKVTKAT